MSDRKDPAGLPRPERVRIQRFEGLALIGAGAMGAVYRARDPYLGREVAIKLLMRPTAAATSILSSHEGTLDLRGETPAGELLVEAQMMARLSHPHVLPVYEVGLANDEIFVVMEYIAGCDLRVWLSGKRTTREILEVFAQAARGLAEAHAHGVVHADFKPENVLVGDDGRVRVADFGLSRLALPAESPLRGGQRIVGTPYYMAPELWVGEGSSAAADVFALCTALAEALATPARRSASATTRGGEPTERLLLDPTLRGHGVDSALRGRGVGRRLRAVIAAGLAAEPAARPSVSGVLAALTARPAVASRWWIVAVAGALFGGAALAAALFSQGRAAAVCDPELAFAGRWDAERQAALEASGVADAVAAQRKTLGEVLRSVCAAEQRGDLSEAHVRRRMSCLERRGMELDAAAARIAVERMPADRVQEFLAQVPSAQDCLVVEAPPLAVERAPVAALYRRLVATYSGEPGSAGRIRELAAVEVGAQALGERELQGRAALELGMRQIESDELDASDASLARSHDLGTAIRSNTLILNALIERGIVAEMRGDAKAAHTYAALAYQTASQPDGPVGARIHATYALARSLTAVGRPKEAIQRVDEAFALGPRDLWTQGVLRRTKTLALRQLGRHEEALAIARESAEIARKTEGERSLEYGFALNVVSWELLSINDRAGALDHRQRALAVMQASYPADHSVIILQRMLVAGDLVSNGRFEEGLAEARAVFAIVDRNESVRAERSEMLLKLGRIEFLSGRFEEGLRLYEEGLDGVISGTGRDHPDVLPMRAQYISYEIQLGRWDDVERHMAALERSYRARTDQALPLALLRGLYGAELARARKDPHSAEARSREALAVLETLHGSEEDRVDLLCVLAASLVDQGRWQEALDALATATTLVRARFPQPDRLAVIDVERVRALAGSGRRSEAKALARSARAVFRRYPGYVSARKAIEGFLAGRRARR